MKRNTVTLVAIMVAGSVAGAVYLGSPRADQARRSAAPGASSTRKTPPLQMTIEGPSQVAPQSAVEITLRIARIDLTSAPMTLKVRLPPGARLIRGLEVETIVDERSPRIERTFHLQIGSVPHEDVSFELLQGVGQLVTRAEAVYRFGRPEPKLAVPLRGKPLRLNDRTVLTPVQVQ